MRAPFMETWAIIVIFISAIIIIIIAYIVNFNLIRRTSQWIRQWIDFARITQNST